ncbi:MAG: TMEM165/GDT1 family protein [Planctomycetota bacterium]|jgi:rubrerythrin|nr:TMEM165/GDT1 family protein [Planctomycetota bacterium]
MEWWRLFSGTFILIFLAELGDKTQLAAMARASGGPAGSSTRWVVFLAASSALVVSTLIAVFFGDLLKSLIPDERYIKFASGALFLVFGTVILYNVYASYRRPEDAEKAPFGEAVQAEETPGYLARLALQAALNFESASGDRYRRLGACIPDSRLAALLESLASEEDRHHARIAELANREPGRSLRLTAECPPPRAVGSEISPTPGGGEWMRNAVENLIEHERASAEFYQSLADRTIVPGVKPVFHKLAEDEWRHLRRLETALKT